VVIVPSPYESLSLLALEAFAVGTPVLANARSEVLVAHCRQSNAGLYYADRYEFAEALRLLLQDSALRSAMGRNGKAYVNRQYRWSAILTKYERLIARLRTQPAREPERPPERERPRDAVRDTRRDSGRDRGRPHGRDRHRSGDRSPDRGGRGARPRR